MKRHRSIACPSRIARYVANRRGGLTLLGFRRDGSPGGRPLGGGDGGFAGHAARTVGGQTWVP